MRNRFFGAMFLLPLLTLSTDLMAQDFKRVVAGAQDYVNLWQPGNELYEKSGKPVSCD